MIVLLGTTLTASFFDCLNPSAIAQQMLPCAMVDKKRHIWFFISGIGLANMALGLAVYYGIAAWALRLVEQVMGAYPAQVGAAELALAAACLLLSARMLRHRAQGTALIRNLERILGRVAQYIVPVAVGLVGLALALHGAISLM